MEGLRWSRSVVSDSLRPHGLYSLPGSSIHGIFQARILEWVAISPTGGSSWSRDQTEVSHIAGRRFTIWATRETLPLYNRKKFKMLTPNKLKLLWKDDKSILSIIEGTWIIGFWCLSDFFQVRDTLLLIAQDSGTLGIQLAICIQFCGTRFFYFVTSAATERFWFSPVFLIPVCLSLYWIRP